MRALVIADLQARDLDLEVLQDPALEVILSCGDVYNSTYRQIRYRSNLPILAVHGNHDDDDWPEGVGVVDLHQRVHCLGGLRFGGFQGCWRYKPHSDYLYTDEEVAQALREFPAVDVFLAHSPMAGVHDVDDGVHNGFPALRHYVERHGPALFLHGHSHRPATSRIGSTQAICVLHWLKLDLPSGA